MLAGHFACALDKVLSQFKGSGFLLLLHKEQKECIYNLFCQRDVLAVLPTGFGKSIIFQVIVCVKEVNEKKCKRYSRLPSKKYQTRPGH